MPRRSSCSTIRQVHRASRYLQDVQSTARSLGKQIRVLKAVNEGEIDAAFVAMARERPDALLRGR